MRFRQRTAEYGEILGKEKHRAPVDGAPAGDDAVAGNFRLLHSEFVRPVLNEHVELFERSLVEQQLNALAGGQLAALVLSLDARLAPAKAGLFTPFLEPVEDVFHFYFGPARYP